MSKSRGDPTPVCYYCGEYAPECGHYVETIAAWACFLCLSMVTMPTDRQFREAIASIWAAVSRSRL